jgi:hypothetical protein
VELSVKWLNEIVKWDTLAKVVATLVATSVVAAAKALSADVKGRRLASRLKQDPYTSEGAKRRIIENIAVYVALTAGRQTYG